ncbi:hypothetical protein L249_0930 [Ophiocordyceps polyrhachis-furcata BCC 54312]|uniref:Glycoside hydrolase family 92 protein n=1 Tax=Ophiocordyceps polyrhachis-furcata BCC 54312 TaxID=1330021 RepID=A0A367LET4_9HYPO|nr:hypothetical protein L249_0930 [Ophiocordyceps polyrhachis-furcata BCC 54312]
MASSLLIQVLIIVVSAVKAQPPPPFDPLDYVDPLIGSINGGNVFAGATVPYGMAKAVADTAGQGTQGGFNFDGRPVTGFSLMHDSGTGGASSLGNFPLFPFASCRGDDVNGCDFPKRNRSRFGSYRRETVEARPGYFGLTLVSGPRVEMTTARHTALFRFGFGRDDKPLILQDLTDLSDSRQDNASVKVDAAARRITGDAVFSPSFGRGRYRAFFCTDFDAAGRHVVDSGIFVDSRASTAVQELLISRDMTPLPGGAFMRFAPGDDRPVLARVGISLISSRQACANAESEMPTWDFEGHRAAAADAWRRKLAPIAVDATGVDRMFVRTLYSGVYRTMISPQNYTGENPLWDDGDDGEPYFDSYYCIWDLFRSQMPLLTIIDPDALAQMIRSLISIYEHDGWMPDCRMSLCRGYTQGGSNADNVLADAFVKGIKGGIDWHKGLDAAKKDADVEPFDWSSRGRGGLDSWKALGYIPVRDFDYKGFGHHTRSISRTLEYAYNDFCISQLAAGLGRTADAERYLGSSGNWRNLWREDQASHRSNGSDTGFTGFFQPRNLNQTWAWQDPLRCSAIDDSGATCSLQPESSETYEGSIWEYGFFVPHAQAELIKLCGGPDAYVRRLRYLHDNGIDDVGNEPSFLTSFQYHYAGRPALSAKRVHDLIPKRFSDTPGGIPGNDDSGAMGAFAFFCMMGLFPNPGQNVYFIVPPFFRTVNVTSPLTGKTATVRAVNFDASYRDVFIQSATLDGKPYSKNWLDHSFFTEGKELVVTLGGRESAWGTAVEDLPPSLGSYAVGGKMKG